MIRKGRKVKQMSKKLMAVFAASIVMTSCRPSQTENSEVLTLMQANDAGDMSTYSFEAFKHWFTTRRALAAQVYKICEPLAAQAPATC